MLFRFTSNLFCFVFINLTIFITFGLISASYTDINAKFEVNYEAGVQEVIYINFNSVKGQLKYFGYDKNKQIFDARQLNGWFLRWGNFYVFPALVTYSPFTPRYLDVKAYYIKDVANKGYILLNHQRGVHMTKERVAISLKGIFSPLKK
ncbi:hypothetical protein BCU78_01955 [Vibrio lentus]|nr:hypothetical protein BCU78_01955 [Vibrio lentus]